MVWLLAGWLWDRVCLVVVHRWGRIYTLGGAPVGDDCPNHVGDKLFASLVC